MLTLPIKKRRRAMQPVVKRVRARIRGRSLELLEDVDLPADGELTVGIEMPATETTTMAEALGASAGAWSDDAHPGLESRDDMVRFVKGLRAGFERRI